MQGMGEIQPGKEEGLVLKGKNSNYLEVGNRKGHRNAGEELSR